MAAKVAPTTVEAAAATPSAGRAVDLGAPTGAGPVLPQVPPGPAFVLLAHADRWAVGTDGRLLPELKRLKLQPGCNNVAAVPLADGTFGTPRWQGAASTMNERGWQTIPTSAGPGGASYLRAYDVVGGVAHVTVFDQTFPGSAHVRCDRAALKAWVDGLVKAGTILGPSELCLERELRDAQARLLRAQTRAKASAEAEADVDIHRKVVKTLEAALADLRSPKKAATPKGAVDLQE